MKKFKKDKLFIDYALSILFILILIFFITSLIFIGRTVFFNKNPIQEHVQNTKKLLNNINQVEKVVNKNEKYTNIAQSLGENLIKTTNFDDEIKVFRYLNLKNSSLITFKLSKKIYKIENFYFTKYDNRSTIKTGDFILYNNLVLGKVTNIEEDKIILLNLDSLSTESINFTNIIGKIIYIDNTKKKDD